MPNGKRVTPCRKLHSHAGLRMAMKGAADRARLAHLNALAARHGVVFDGDDPEASLRAAGIDPWSPQHGWDHFNRQRYGPFEVGPRCYNTRSP